MNIELDIGRCTKDPETCPVIMQLFELDEFENVIQQLDSSSAERRKILGDFVTSCVNGNCPGQDPELTIQILNRNRGVQ